MCEFTHSFYHTPPRSGVQLNTAKTFCLSCLKTLRVRISPPHVLQFNYLILYLCSSVLSAGWLLNQTVFWKQSKWSHILQVLHPLPRCDKPKSHNKTLLLKVCLSFVRSLSVSQTTSSEYLTCSCTGLINGEFWVAIWIRNWFPSIKAKQAVWSTIR
jgi:hypothetical protein